MLIRQTLLYLPAQVLGPLVQLVAMVVWTHFLTPKEMGLLALIIAAQELIYSATLFWFSVSTVRYFDGYDQAGERERFLNTESFVFIATTLVCICAVIILPLFLGDNWSWPLFIATLLFIITRGMLAHLSDRARASHDTLSYTFMQTCWPVVGLISGLAFVEFFNATTAWVLFGYVVGHVVTLLVAFKRMEFGRLPWQFDAKIIEKSLRYGMPLVAGAVLVWVAQNSLRFIVEWQQGAAAVGLITVGWGLGLRVSGFASMLVTAAAFPLAVHKSRDGRLDEGQLQLQQNGTLLIAALLPACVGLWLIGDQFVTLTVAEPFQEVTRAVLPWALLAGGMRSLRLHFGEQVFLLREQTWVPLTNDLFDAALATIGILIGLMLDGLHGAVIGGAVGATLSCVFTLVWAWLAHAFTLNVSDTLKISAATVLMALMVWLSPSEAAIFAVVVSVIAGGFIYAAALVGLFPEIRTAIRQYLAR